MNKELMFVFALTAFLNCAFVEGVSCQFKLKNNVNPLRIIIVFTIKITKVNITTDPEYLSMIATLRDENGENVVDVAVDIIKDLGNDVYVYKNKHLIFNFLKNIIIF